MTATRTADRTTPRLPGRAVISDIDRQRLEAWASCGFNARAAALAHPELGCERTFQYAVERHENTLVGLFRTILADSATAA